MGKERLKEIHTPAGMAKLQAILDELGERQSLGTPAADEKAGALDGRYIAFTGTGAEQEIAHKLGRTPKGFFVVGKSATGDVWQPGTRASNEQVVYLAGTNTVAFTVMLF